jgi:multidrug transporter EmrE-like cation transporter
MRAGLGWLLASVCCSSVGHLSLKLAATSLQRARDSVLPPLAALLTPWLCLGIALHVIALGLWVTGLRRVELSIAYPFIALGLVLVTLLSWSVLGERPAPSYWLGLVLIIAGVLTVAAR